MTRARIAVFALLTGLFVTIGAGSASAHATLKETSPGAGEIVDASVSLVRLAFDEPIKTVGQGVRVFGPGGERVDAGRSTVNGGNVRAEMQAEQRGTYTVAWRVVSDDGHNLSGSFVFHFGRQTGAVDVTERVSVATSGAGGLGRFATFAAAILIVGASALAGYSRDDSVASGPELVRWLVAGSLGVGGAVAIASALAIRQLDPPALRRPDPYGTANLDETVAGLDSGRVQ